MRSLIRGAVALLIVSSGAAAPAQVVWDVTDTSRPGQWTIYNRTARGSELGMPVELADFDGDGRDDVLLSPMNAASGPGRGRPAAGELSIVLSSGEIAGVVDFATFDPAALPANAALVYGRDARDLLGTETAAADVDGDGYDDVIAGVQLGDGPGNTRPGSGEVAILWGRPDFGGRVYDTAAPGDVVTFVYGADEGDRLGVWVSTGDLDGDGTQDLVLGADQGNGPTNDRPHVGETWVLYGGSHLRTRAEIDLAAPDVPSTVVYGIDEEDHSGCTVRAGDLDGDGTDELLIGAGLNRLSASFGNLPPPGPGGHGARGGDGPANDRFSAGEAYALYLGPGARPASIDLRTPPASTVFVYGADNGDAYGEELFVGDFDGDGFGDIAVGAIVGDSIDNSRLQGGDLALVMGGADLPGSVIDLRAPPANVVFFYGATSGAIAGDTAMFADVDADGRDELIIASPNAPVEDVSRVGVTHVFFGTEAALPPVIDLADVPAGVAYLLVEGADFNDMLAYSMAYGDADADGLDDLVLNVMDGDGFENRIPSSGDAYVLSGAEIVRAVAEDTPTPTPTVTPRPTSTPTLVVVGCPGDCNGDGRVSINELVAGVNQSLMPVAPLPCPQFDANGDGTVAINELVAAVAAALQGCAL